VTGDFIPAAALYRLLDNIVWAERLRTDPREFAHIIRDGANFTPDLDAEDIATLARIAAGYGYEDDPRCVAVVES
jgi:hypothetical protein